MLLYKMFVHELLATQNTVVPRKLFKTSGLALHQTIMAWPWDKKTSAMCTAEDIVYVCMYVYNAPCTHTHTYTRIKVAKRQDGVW